MVGKGLVPHFSVFHSVIKGCCAVGKVKEAAEIMSWMLDLGVVPHVESWSSVIRCVCNNEDCIEAVLLQMVTGKRHGSRTISRCTLK
jgi:pentatricopeptide repeat protein